jgi:DNA-binding transcriptional LysR family regulator
MIDDLRGMAIFYKTVEMGSFRAAAKELQLSPSVISHHIAQLENRLGVTLLYRSTRNLSLTNEGKCFFEAARNMIHAAECGLNAIIPQSNQPAGEIKINMPAILARSQLMKSIAKFSDAYPKVKLTIRFSDRVQEMTKEGVDISIRIGNMKDSAFKSKKIFSIERKLVAAPWLISNPSAIKDPAKLENLNWIDLQMLPPYRVVKNKDGKKIKIHFTPKIIVDSVDAACQLAIAGAGIASPPAFLADSEIKKGTLLELLPEWQLEPLGVYAIWQPNILKTSLTSLFKDYL